MKISTLFIILIFFSSPSIGQVKKWIDEDGNEEAKAYLKSNAIVYREYDIDTSVSAKYDYEKSGGKSLPFLVRGDDVLSGFTEQGYDIFFDEDLN